MSIKQLEITEFYSDGQQVFERVKFLTEMALKNNKNSVSLCPVAILLLDF